MPRSFDSIIIFTDGACSGNPGPGGWASIVVYPEGKLIEMGGHLRETTNNRMELSAAERALASLTYSEPRSIDLYTDSTYVIRGITQWIWGWRSSGWKTSAGKEVSNRDLWETLLGQVMRLTPTKINWHYLRGHTGVPGNERCDEIAVGFSKGAHVTLYEGTLLQYGIAIHDLPDNTDLPSLHSPSFAQKKERPFSYLSLRDGLITRHKTWIECERHVKGRQAKYKKTTSEQDEHEILKGWGLDPNNAVIKVGP